MFYYILVSLLVVLCGVQYKVITKLENLQAEINTTKVNAKDDLEATHLSLLKTLISQKEELISQQFRIEQLKLTLTVDISDLGLSLLKKISSLMSSQTDVVMLINKTLTDIDDLEAIQTSLLKTITSQQEQLTSQQIRIEQLKQTLTDTRKSQWSDWTSWGDCFTSCSGNNGGRIQTRSREATVTGSKMSEEESRPCNAVLFAGCVQTSGKNDNFAVAYDYADMLAQSTCTSIFLGADYVSAVRRQCSALSSDCASVCKNLGKTCFNALHVYTVKALTRDAVGTTGLQMHRYNSCGGSFCGPNYCCCSGK